LKIVMLGEGRTTLRIQLTVSSCWGANPWLHAGRVGKTSLVLRYCKDTFSDKQVSTIQASYLQKRLTLGSTTCNLAIWVRGAALFSLHCLQSRAVPVPAGYRRSRAIPCFGSDLLPRRRRYLRLRTLPSSSLPSSLSPFISTPAAAPTPLRPLPTSRSSFLPARVTATTADVSRPPSAAWVDAHGLLILVGTRAVSRRASRL
jgi:hypothetical protein